MKKYLSLFLIIISSSGYILAQNGACNVATNFTSNLSLNPQNYPTTDSTLWFKFKTDSAAIRISVNISGSAVIMPLNIKRITLYSGVCDTLNLLDYTNTIN
jgi:hypothetical protein